MPRTPPDLIDTTGAIEGKVLVHSGPTSDEYEVGDPRNVVILVRNETGTPFTKGQLVASVGLSGGVITVDLADKDDGALRPTLGMLQEDLPIDTNGFAVSHGVVSGINTSAFSVTDQLVLGSAGAPIRPPPDTAGFTGEIQDIGHVLYSDASAGQIQVLLSGMEVDSTAIASPDGTVAAAVALENYNNTSGIGAQDVAYVRTFLPQGIYSKMETTVTAGANGVRVLDMGIYADSGGPLNFAPSGALLASTGAVAPSAVGFYRVDLTSNLEVPFGGSIYWLAIVASAVTLVLATTFHVSPAEHAGRLFKFQGNVGTDTLPATVGTLDADSNSSVIRIAAVRF